MGGKKRHADPVDLAQHMASKRKAEEATRPQLTKAHGRDIPPEYWWVVQQTVVNLQVAGALPVQPGAVEEAVQVGQNTDRQLAGKPIIVDRTLRLRELLLHDKEQLKWDLTDDQKAAVVAWLGEHKGDA